MRQPTAAFPFPANQGGFAVRRCRARRARAGDRARSDRPNADPSKASTTGCVCARPPKPRSPSPPVAGAAIPRAGTSPGGPRAAESSIASTPPKRSLPHSASGLQGRLKELRGAPLDLGVRQIRLVLAEAETAKPPANVHGRAPHRYLAKSPSRDVSSGVARSSVSGQRKCVLGRIDPFAERPLFAYSVL